MPQSKVASKRDAVRAAQAINVPTCDACRAQISEAQQALSRMRYDDAPRLCKSCVTEENTQIRTASMARDIAASNNDAPTKMFAALIIIRTVEKDYPWFDRARFLKACGLGQTS